MWFGDLVTMTWWSDLWLKESFADYCAGKCLTHIAPTTPAVKGPKLSFLSYLTAAMREDILETTHPVQVTVNDTIDAVNVFDMICYRKGACIIQQIDYYIGEDVLKAGMKDYFSKFAYKTTIMSDFTGCF